MIGKLTSVQVRGRGSSSLEVERRDDWWSSGRLLAHVFSGLKPAASVTWTSLRSGEVVVRLAIGTLYFCVWSVGTA